MDPRSQKVSMHYNPSMLPMKSTYFEQHKDSANQFRGYGEGLVPFKWQHEDSDKYSYRPSKLLQEPSN